MPPMGGDSEALGGPSLPVLAPLGGPTGEDSVPLSALASADESNTMTTPAVGDRVSYTVDGKIIRMAGTRAIVKKETVNGQADDSEGGPTPNEPPADSIDKLSSDASAMDINQYD